MSFTSKFAFNPAYKLSVNSRSYWLVAMILVIFTLYGLSSAFTRGIANAWYFKAEFSLNDWAENNTIADKNDYIQTLDSIKKAQSLDPTHPHYAHMLGRVLHWGVDMGYEDKSQLTEIKGWYLLATQLRPSWPDPWADLARLNNYLEGYNSETKLYIERALAVGPYINFVTIATIQVWLSNWPVLTGKERSALFKQFDVATKQYNTLAQVIKFSKSINREKLLCSQLTYNSDYERHKRSSIYKRYCLN